MKNYLRDASTTGARKAKPAVATRQSERLLQSLRESEEKYRTVVERANDGIIIVQDGIIRYANPRMAELDGSTVDLLTGSSITDHVHPSAVEAVTEMYRRRTAGERVPCCYETVLKRRDGAAADAELNAAVITYEGRPAVIVIIRDITDRKRTEEALRQVKDNLERRVEERTSELRKQAQLLKSERDRLRTLLDSMNDGVWLLDAAGNILLANRVAREQAVEVGLDPDTPYGPQMLTEVEAFTLDGMPLGMEILAKALQGKPLPALEIGVRNRKGGPTFYRRLSVNRMTETVTGVPDAVVVVQDMTPQKRADEEKARLEEQLRHAQKMEAIGRLAGGIAHDFNNMLAVILGNAELAMEDLKDDGGPVENLKQILKASKRAKDLTGQILAFSRKTERGRNPLKLSPLLRETFELLRGTLPATIRMEVEIETESDTVLADPSQIQQVLVNLATNAAHAMRTTGGVLTMRLSLVDVKHEGQIPGVELAPGRYVRLSVQDTGTGIPDNVRLRIFEPFFTTKESGRGSGMGLAVAYGIVKNHEGEITVESRPGHGSTFHVFLPLSDQEASVEREKTGGIPRGKERLLLVDDEPGVLLMTAHTLERLGYKVTTAENGTEAWETFVKEPRSFDLIITDQIMPDITGLDLAGKMLEARKDMPIILITGYSEMVSPESARKAGIRAFVMKPVARREVAETIRKVLTSPAS